MTVKELIMKLTELPHDDEVWMSANGGEYVWPLVPDEVRVIEMDGSTGLTRVELGT